jgi:hypothetical protein
VRVIDLSAQPKRGFTQFPALVFIEIRRGRALDDLLVAALNRAIALEQVDEVAVRVAQNLHFDMACATHQLFDIDFIVAERSLRLAARALHLPAKFGFGLDHAHAAAAATPARLHHHRVADFGHQLLAGLEVVRQGAGGRQHRHPGGDCRGARRDLVTERAQHLRAGADEADARRRTGVGELRILREKAIAGMDRVNTRFARDTHDVGNVEIGGDRLLALADQIAFIGFKAMQREAILVRVDRHRADAEFGGGAHHPNRNFAAVRDQQLADGGA